jgi:hypothetical protein
VTAATIDVNEIYVSSGLKPAKENSSSKMKSPML